MASLRAPAKTVRISVVGGGASFDVGLFDGVEPQAVERAVAARLRLRVGQFFVTAGPERGAVLVPLSAALPDGLALTLHRAEPEELTPFSPAPAFAVPSPPSSPTQPGSRQQAPHGRFGGAAPLSPAAAAAANGCKETTPRFLARLSAPKPVATSPASPARLGCGPPALGGGFGGPVAPLPCAVCEAKGYREPLLGQACGSLGEPAGRQWEEPSVCRAKSTSLLQERVRRPSLRSSRGSCRSFADEGGRTPAERAADTMERFSLMSVDLSNERTLLAWIRTCLAAMRTSFAYLTLTSAATIWRLPMLASEVAIASLVIILAAIGHCRYSSVEVSINQKKPPHGFGRLSVRYMSLLVLVSSAVTATGVLSHQWQRD